jgi:hypothetical protein
MTVQEAVDEIRKIQRELDAGRLRPPFPTPIRKKVYECGKVFMAYSTSNEKAKELVALINAPEGDLELPW